MNDPKNKPVRAEHIRQSSPSTMSLTMADPLSVTCPKCGATISQPCERRQPHWKIPTNRRMGNWAMKGYHAVRTEAAKTKEKK